jgi:hypothetical protein
MITPMNKIIAVLLVSLMSPTAFARDYFQDDKYTNPRARGVDSVYDEPGTSRYENNSNNSYEESYSNRGVTSDRYQVNDNGLVINKSY